MLRAAAASRMARPLQLLIHAPQIAVAMAALVEMREARPVEGAVEGPRGLQEQVKSEATIRPRAAMAGPVAAGQTVGGPLPARMPSKAGLPAKPAATGQEGGGGAP